MSRQIPRNKHETTFLVFAVLSLPVSVTRLYLSQLVIRSKTYPPSYMSGVSLFTVVDNTVVIMIMTLLLLVFPNELIERSSVWA